MIWRKQKRAPQDPTWIFSTWPIPQWSGSYCLLTVSAADGPPELRDTVDYVYGGVEEQPRLQQIMDRLSAVGGSLRMTGGTYELNQPLRLDNLGPSTITGCWFK